MKQLRYLVAIGALVLAIASMKMLSAQENEQHGLSGASYISTVTDSNGNFSSRGVITLHADKTMSVTDSGQGGPAFLFSSQQGAWRRGNNGSIIGKTIDFDFPSVDVARVDYVIAPGSSSGTIKGTITLTTFPLTGNPLDGGGTVIGTFTFVGQVIKP